MNQKGRETGAAFNQRVVNTLNEQFDRADKAQRPLRRLSISAVASVIAYPTILAVADKLLPSGNLIVDMAKYGFEFFLSTIAAGSLTAYGNQRRLSKVAEQETWANVDRMFEERLEEEKNWTPLQRAISIQRGEIDTKLVQDYLNSNYRNQGRRRKKYPRITLAE